LFWVAGRVPLGREIEGRADPPKLENGMSTIALPVDMDVALAPRLDHLRALEAESLQILREVAAEFERPVMLYSIGKDSSVMLRLAQKAFHPGPIPFPLLHVDTTYKFK
jgi:sulfate adenylyltransferase subunit 2